MAKKASALKGGNRTPAAQKPKKKKEVEPRKKPYTPDQLRGLQPRFEERIGKLKQLAHDMETKGVLIMTIDGNGMLQRAFKQIDRFINHGNTSLTEAEPTPLEVS